MHDWAHTTAGWTCVRCGLHGGLAGWPEYAGHIECYDAARCVQSDHVDPGSGTVMLSPDDIAETRELVHDRWGRVFERLAKGDTDG